MKSFEGVSCAILICSIVFEGLATSHTLVPEGLDVERATGTSSLILLTVTQASFHTCTNAFLVVRVALWC